MLPDDLTWHEGHPIWLFYLQAALLAATKDRESAQAALAEAKTRQEETAEVQLLSMLTSISHLLTCTSKANS